MEKTNLNSCDGFLERIDDFVDGHLTGSELQEAKAHLSSCEDCRREMEETESLIQAAGELPLDVQPPAELWPAVNEQIGGQVGWTQAEADKEYTKERLAMVAAVLFLAVMPFMGSMPAMFDGGWMWGKQGDSSHQVSKSEDVVTKARSYDEAKQVLGRGFITISNVAGSLRIVGWDKNVVKVNGKLADNVQGVKFDVKGSATDIEVLYPKIGECKGAWLTVQVPKESHLKINTVSAVPTVLECDGHVEINTVSAPIVMHRIGGSIRAKTVSGDLRINGGVGEVNARTTSGNISLRHCKGKVEMKNVSGRIDLSSEKIEHLIIKATSGDVHYRGPLLKKGRYFIKSVSGGIHLRLPEGTKAKLTTKSMSGMTRTNIDNADEPDLPIVVARTLSGSITAMCRDWSKLFDVDKALYAEKVHQKLRQAKSGKSVTVETGNSRVVKVDGIWTAYVLERDVVEVTRLSESEILLRGLKKGQAVLQLYHKNGYLTKLPVIVSAPSK